MQAKLEQWNTIKLQETFMHYATFDSADVKGRYNIVSL